MRVIQSIFFSLAILVIASAGVLAISITGNNEYSELAAHAVLSQNTNGDERKSLVDDSNESSREVAPVTHIKTPADGVRALYMSSWIASRPDLRTNVIELIEKTQLNAVMIDVKDVTGQIMYNSDDPIVNEYGKVINRIPDLGKFIAELHEKDIFVIARIAVFKDDHLAAARPDIAVKTTSGTLWRDRRGKAWVDQNAPEVYEYMVALARDAYARGFDEINLDYVRFPSDGNMKNISYPRGGQSPDRRAIMTRFFTHLDEELRWESNIPVSADIFGMTMNNYDDLTIGQVLEDIAPHVDAVGPMIYPSHYPDTFSGYAKPAEHPYEIVEIALKKGVTRLVNIGEDMQKIRPWIQDFSIHGVNYGPERVAEQIQASYDQGLKSFYVWDPSNKYTDQAYTHLMPDFSTLE